jgi:hypothetical protein
MYSDLSNLTFSPFPKSCCEDKDLRPGTPYSHCLEITEDTVGYVTEVCDASSSMMEN